MDSAQKRARERKQRQRREEKEARKKDRAEQKLLRATLPAGTGQPDEAVPGGPVDGASPPATTGPVAGAPPIT